MQKKSPDNSSEAELNEFLNIGALSRLVGIPADTLRTWERRYGVPTPLRSPSGHRRYSPDCIERLRLVREALKLGHRVSAALAWSIDELRRVGGSSTASDPATESPRLEAPSEPMLIAAAVGFARRFDDKALEGFLHERWARDSTPGFISRVAAPLLTAIGEAWQAGDLQICHEHHATERLRFFVESRWRELSAHARGPLVVSASPAGEHHVLGLHLATLVATLEGAQVVFLGADVPSIDIARTVDQLAVDGIMLSISSCVPVASARAALAELVELCRNTPILIGGSGAPTDMVCVQNAAGDFQVASRWVRSLQQGNSDA